MSTNHLLLTRALVPMIYVADVERSAAFYRHLGFEIGNYVPRESEPKEWAWLYAPAAEDWKRGPNLMVTRRTGAPRHESATEVLFYLYTPDLKSLRATLLAAGLDPSQISYPDYLPNGELRIVDPDGYALMIAQAAADTP